MEVITTGCAVVPILPEKNYYNWVGEVGNIIYPNVYEVIFENGCTVPFARDEIRLATEKELNNMNHTPSDNLPNELTKKEEALFDKKQTRLKKEHELYKAMVCHEDVVDGFRHDWVYLYSIVFGDCAGLEVLTDEQFDLVYQWFANEWL